ncbi:MAG: metallophosphoesterase [Gaiellales bacterium]|nr:MAG: metallophosphoesterase [Gaiellales bacterium]
MKKRPQKTLAFRPGHARRALAACAGAGAALTGYMLFEAQWLQVRRLELDIPGLPQELAGMRILHASDLHAGAPGPGSRALDKFIAAAKDCDPDLVLFTGDMTDKKKELGPYVSRLGEIGARYGKFAVLGNHDHGLRKTVMQDLALKLLGRGHRGAREAPDGSRQAATISRTRELLSRAGVELLANECRSVEMGGGKVQVCGIDDFQYGYGDLAAAKRQFDDAADLRILLSHSPDAVAGLESGDYQLVLAGHTHGGQICIPRPGGKILLSSSGSDYGDGVYRTGAAIMHVSRGVGTTLLPFRLLSRPEVTVIRLAAGTGAGTSPAC